MAATVKRLQDKLDQLKACVKDRDQVITSLQQSIEEHKQKNEEQEEALKVLKTENESIMCLVSQQSDAIQQMAEDREANDKTIQHLKSTLNNQRQYNWIRE